MQVRLADVVAAAAGDVAGLGVARAAVLVLPQLAVARLDERLLVERLAARDAGRPALVGAAGHRQGPDEVAGVRAEHRG